MDYLTLGVSPRCLMGRLLRQLLAAGILLLSFAAFSPSAKGQSFDNYGPGSCSDSGSFDFSISCSAYGLDDFDSYYVELYSSSASSGCVASPMGMVDAGASSTYITASAQVQVYDVYGMAYANAYADRTGDYYSEGNATINGPSGLSVSIYCV
jgi:hypothetical protein